MHCRIAQRTDNKINPGAPFVVTIVIVIVAIVIVIVVVVIIITICPFRAICCIEREQQISIPLT